MSRIVVVGDTHGCSAEVRELLRVVSWRRNTGDRLVFLGDFLDRGPDPVGCVQIALDEGAESIQGNHEEKALRFLRHEARRAATGKANPMGPPPEKNHQEWSALTAEHVRWLSSLPVTLPLQPGWIAVHGGFEGIPRAEQRPDRLIRCRYLDPATGAMVPFKQGDSLEQPPGTVYWTEMWSGPESVIYGHAVHSLEAPRVDRGEGFACFGIDTGCCYGGRLTAMILHPDREPEFAQVPAFATYATLPAGLAS